VTQDERSGLGSSNGVRPSRRLFLQVLGALPATAWLSTGCSSSGPRYLTDTERRVLAACADAIYPPDDTGPGAAELGAVDFIDTLLTAFEHDPPRIHAAGPFSDRNPYPAADGSPSSRFPPDQFLEYLPLSRVQRAGWQLRLYGSRGTPGGGPNDAVLGPVIGLRDLLRDGVQQAIESFPTPIDQLSDAALQAIYDFLPEDARAQVELLVLQSLFSLPEYGGNRASGGWRLIHFDGDSMPLGYTYVDPATHAIRDRPDAPVIGPETRPDPDPMDDETISLFRAATAVLGGKAFY
jgi:gluconate 2-dehydrogenase gamma chain